MMQSIRPNSYKILHFVFKTAIYVFTRKRSQIFCYFLTLSSQSVAVYAEQVSVNLQKPAFCRNRGYIPPGFYVYFYEMFRCWMAGSKERDRFYS
ncbi:hypothetical protein [Coleofasciculus sp. FACHB-1120]|uniref:hypothetical protein n=1 Tax=Coleofasciculus sp. FACHB-1120 TaxID=2692783 RepID=UPI0016895F1C|nr:hypothetical protein [Coleofasciculus sp. FACHB-1120]MBD2740270.1 hypothetical protein [Coleofasciculus sp. FACHB-1120]